VTVKDNSDVTITGVTVDGRDQGGIASPPGAYNFAGVYVINSDADIDGIAVTNVRELQGGETSGNQRNHAVIVTGYGAETSIPTQFAARPRLQKPCSSDALEAALQVRCA